MNAQQTGASQLYTAALGALSGGSTAATDVVLTGTVAVATGAHTAQGTVRLVSNGSGMTRVEVHMPSGTSIETRRGASQTPAGESQLSSESVKPTPLHNLLVDPAWFFPEHLVSRAIASTRSATLVPAAQMDGTTAVGIDSYLVSALPSHSATLRQISEMKVFLDQTTSLPVELQFNHHASESLLKIIPTRIVYGNYTSVQGHMVPFHIQEYESGLLHEDITITTATINPGVAASEYSLQ